MKTLKFKSDGKEVELLTKILKKRGYISEVSSYFGTTVKKAVQQFQAAHVDPRDRPLAPDGIVGPLTWWALQNDNVSKLKFPNHTTERICNMYDLEDDEYSTFGEIVVSYAVDEILSGGREIGKNNSGKFVKKYLSKIVPVPNNWCAGFVSYCFQKAANKNGIEMPFKYSVGAKNIYKQFYRKGWTYKATHDDPPKPGDIIVWHRGVPKSWKGHIGLVAHYEDGIVYTIEGNKGIFPAKVRAFTYELGRINKLYGFGRVKDVTYLF